MTDKQPEALRLADGLEKVIQGINPTRLEMQIAALLRTQHAAIERKDALLRQALEALNDGVDYVREDYRTNWRHGVPSRQAQLDDLKAQVDEHEAAIEAITKELSQ